MDACKTTPGRLNIPRLSEYSVDRLQKAMILIVSDPCCLIKVLKTESLLISIMVENQNRITPLVVLLFERFLFKGFPVIE